MNFLSILFAVLLFSFLIFIHELGHFLTAKLSGVRVNEFAMFMGPAIFKKQAGETLYSLRCIPIGGYCAMEGEDQDTDDPRSFQKAAWWKRLCILVAGSAMNFLAGVVLLLVVFSFNTGFAQPEIAYTEPGCKIVSEDGIHLGDEFYAIDGYRTFTSSDVSLLLSFGDDIHHITVLRDGEKLTFSDYKMEKSLFLNEQTQEEEERYGFTFGVADKTFPTLLSYTWDSTCSVIQTVWLSLKMLLTGQAGIKDMTGPVGIVSVMTQTAQASPDTLSAVLNLLYMGGFIALNLAVMNLLPIPALDGGRCVGLLLTTVIEKILRRKLDPKYEGYIHAAGMVLLLAFMAFIMFKDIFVIFKG